MIALNIPLHRLSQPVDIKFGLLLLQELNSMVFMIAIHCNIQNSQ